jgi:GNAT superfamily N-acetyltransferase
MTPARPCSAGAPGARTRGERVKAAVEPQSADGFDGLRVSEAVAGEREEKHCVAELLDIYWNYTCQNGYFFIAATDDSDRPSDFVRYGRIPLTDAAYDLYWIPVDEGRRRNGIGRRLLEHTEGILKAWGARLVISAPSGLEAHEPARRFYIKDGFTEEARIKEHYKPGDDLIIYVKRLQEHTI